MSNFEISTNVRNKGTFTKRRSSFSVAGCGFMGMYHIGVSLCIEEHAEELFTELTNWYGASAGSIAGVLVCCGIRAIDEYMFMKKVHRQAYKHKYLGRFCAFNPNFDLTGYVRSFLERILPRNAHRLCRNKLGVSLTVLPSMKNWIVTDFNTRDELIQAIICSSFVPLLGQIKPPIFRGKMCCDGGLSNNLPYSNDPNIITVSPFSGECDICPNGETETQFLAYVTGQAMQCSWSNIYMGFRTVILSSWKDMDDVCAQGFRDTYKFLKREGIIKTSLAPIITIASMIDNDTKNGSTYSHQSSTASRCLDQLLVGQLETKRLSLLVEKERSNDDEDELPLKPKENDATKLYRHKLSF